MSEDDSSRLFQSSANPRQALIGIARLAMRLIQTMGCDPTTRLGCDFRNVMNMIEMPVGDQNTADREMGPAALAQRAMQCTNAAYKTGIDEI